MYYDIEKSGERIRELRKARGFSQNEFAERIGVHVKTISKAERGIIGLSVDNLLVIAECFDTTIDFLVSGKEKYKYDEKMNLLIENLNREQKAAVYEILENILKLSKI
mgnify:CR=1 FL=1|jgi:transcriptional regulator with XRE-family HTH domain